MSEMSYFNKFSKIVKLCRLCATNAQLTSDFGDLKLRDLPKSVLSNRLWQNRTLKNRLWRHFSDL